MQEITIYDIAKKAGVSASTVSRVLNDFPYVKPSTRAKVLKTIKENHYIVNETARGLKTQSSRMVGILLSDIRTTHHTDGVYYIQRILSQKGYSCLIYNTGTDEEEQVRYIRMLSQRNVDAAILMGSIYQTDAIRKAVRNYLPVTPVVICNGYLEAPNIYGLIADEQNGVCDCVRLLAEKGRKTLAFVVDHHTPSNRLKQRGFEEGIFRFYRGDSPLVVETSTSIQDVLDAVTHLKSSHPAVDGIIFAEDRLAVIGMRALSEMGFSIPDHVAVIGINNSQYAQICNPPLTSLDNMLYDLSLMASRNLIALMKGERINQKMMICSAIVERKTT